MAPTKYLASRVDLYEIRIIVCFDLKKCNYGVNHKTPLSLFRNKKKDHVTHNWDTL